MRVCAWETGRSQKKMRAPLVHEDTSLPLEGRTDGGGYSACSGSSRTKYVHDLGSTASYGNVARDMRATDKIVARRLNLEAFHYEGLAFLFVLRSLTD